MLRNLPLLRRQQRRPQVRHEVERARLPDARIELAGFHARHLDIARRRGIRRERHAPGPARLAALPRNQRSKATTRQSGSRTENMLSNRILRAWHILPDVAKPLSAPEPSTLPMNPRNIQHPRSNSQWEPLRPLLDVGGSMLDGGCSLAVQGIKARKAPLGDHRGYS